VRRLSRQSSKLSNFSEKGTHGRDDRAVIDTCIADSSMCIEHIINPVRHWIRLIRRLMIEGSMKPNSGARCMKSYVNRGVRTVNADQPVA
jgi:hypothetical protein